MVLHWPCRVNIGDINWNERTVPVGRRFAKCADILKVFLMAFCAGVLGVLGGSTGAFSRSGCCVSRKATRVSLFSTFFDSIDRSAKLILFFFDLFIVCWMFFTTLC